MKQCLPETVILLLCIAAGLIGWIFLIVYFEHKKYMMNKEVDVDNKLKRR